MTMLIGALAGDYSILAADTRVTWPSRFHYRDGECKIAMYRSLAITGAGHAPTLTRIKRALIAGRPDCEQDILQIMSRNISVEKGSESCFLMTYRDSTSGTSAPKLALVSTGPPMTVVRDQNPIVIIPPGIPARTGMTLRRQLTHSLISTPTAETWIETLSRHLQVIGACYRYVCDRSDRVSRDLDIAVMHANGSTLNARAPAERFYDRDVELRFE